MKLTKILIVGAMVCVGSLIAEAQSFQSLPFVNGWNLYLTNGVAVTTASSTEIYTKSWVQTNAITYQTNGTTIYTNYNGASSYAPVYVTNTAGITDLNLWANRDGSVALVNLSADIVGYNASFTNLITIVFTPVSYESGAAKYGQLTYPSTSPSFSWAINANGLTHVVVSTNLPASFIQGCKALHITSITPSSETASTNGCININLNGYKPNQP